VIQIDEPALSVRAEELKVALDSMKVVTEGLDAYFLTHVCYGAFEFIYPKMLEMPVENFDLELSNSELDLLKMFSKHKFTKDISFGVYDVHSHKVDPPEVIKRRIAKALEVLKPEQIWIDPDCGLKTRTVGEAIAQLTAMQQATVEARKGL